MFIAFTLVMFVLLAISFYGWYLVINRLGSVEIEKFNFDGSKAENIIAAEYQYLMPVMLLK